MLMSILLKIFLELLNNKLKRKRPDEGRFFCWGGGCFAAQSTSLKKLFKSSKS